MPKFTAEVTVRLDVEFEVEPGGDPLDAAYSAVADQCDLMSQELDADVHRVTPVSD